MPRCTVARLKRFCIRIAKRLLLLWSQFDHSPFGVGGSQTGKDLSAHVTSAQTAPGVVSRCVVNREDDLETPDVLGRI